MPNTNQATIDDRTKAALTAYLRSLIADKQHAMNDGLAQMSAAAESGDLRKVHEALVDTVIAFSSIGDAVQHAIKATGTCLYDEPEEKSGDPLAPRMKSASPLPFFIR